MEIEVQRVKYEYETTDSPLVFLVANTRENHKIIANLVRLDLPFRNDTEASAWIAVRFDDRTAWFTDIVTYNRTFATIEQVEALSLLEDETTRVLYARAENMISQFDRHLSKAHERK